MAGRGAREPEAARPSPAGGPAALRGLRAVSTLDMAAAAAVSCAKRNLRAELKQRLRAISAEERLRQSRLLTQKVRDCGIGLPRGPSPRAPGRPARACGCAQAQAYGARTSPAARARPWERVGTLWGTLPAGERGGDRDRAVTGRSEWRCPPGERSVVKGARVALGASQWG